MHNNRATLQRVGLVLLGVGILNIAYTIYRLSQEDPNGFSVGILAITAGVFLLRGHLQAARIVTWGAAFAIAHIISTLFILLPLSKPADLWATEFRLNPVGLWLSLLVQLGAIALFLWIYTQLRTATIASTHLKSDQPTSAPTLAFILGTTQIVLLTSIIHFTTSGEAGEKAVKLARIQYGEHYKYHITALRWSDGSISANVTAYNEQEIKPIHIEWQQ